MATGLQDFLTKIEKLKDQQYRQHIDTLNFFKIEFVEETTLDISKQNDPSKYAKQLNDYNFSQFVQRITLPTISETIVQTDSKLLGTFPTHTSIVFPTTNNLQMEIINTREANIEYLLHSWIREVHGIKWKNEFVPYSTIEIRVNLTDHTDFIYHFINCRPNELASHTADHQLRSNSALHDLNFVFDYMYLEFPEKNVMTSQSGNYNDYNQYDQRQNFAQNIV